MERERETKPDKLIKKLTIKQIITLIRKVT